MENTYAVIWIAKTRDKFGVGTKRFSKEEAEDLAAELNQSYSAFLHHAFDTATADQNDVLAVLKAELTASEAAASVPYPDFVAVQAAAAQEQPLLPPSPDKVIHLDAAARQVLPAVGQ